MVAVVAVANIGLAGQVLDLQDRLEQRTQWQVNQTTTTPRPATIDAGVTRASLGASCQACVIDSAPHLPWAVVLGFASVLSAVAMAAMLTMRIRTHGALLSEVGRRRTPMRGDHTIRELSTDLAGANRLMVELNHVASLIQRTAGDNAHALRSPLSVVKIAIGRIRAQVPADEAMVNAALDAAEANVDRISEIIDAAQRLDEDTAALILAPRRTEELADIVRDALQCCTPQLEAASLRVSSRLQDRVFVDASEGTLEELLDDLLRNALLASPSRGLIAVQLIADGDAAVLRIEDQGPWISVDALDSALERDYTPFNQPPSPRMIRRRAYYVASRNAELLGGHLELDNKPDGGLTVVVSLPLARRFEG